MKTDKLFTYAAIGIGGYLIYTYLQSSGLWAQWFGGPTAAIPANTFTDPAALLAYCQANPNGTASYSVNGVVSTSPCSAWIAAQQTSSAPITMGSPTPVQPGNYQQAIAAMKTAAGNNSQNLDNWAFYWQNGVPFSGSPAGFGIPGSISSAQMDQLIKAAGGDRTISTSAEQFVAWLNTASVPTGMQGLQYDDPYRRAQEDWVN